jgi:two-component sensor histidine kinase
MAQQIKFDSAIHQIDSLILYKRLDIAQKKVDSLHKVINSINQHSKYKEEILKVRFRQAVIFDNQNESSVEPLTLLLDIKDKAEALHSYSLLCNIYLMIALIHEKSNNLELTNKYLNEAYEIYKDNKLEELYSTYCIRKSSYYRFVNERDSAFYYAQKGKEYAEKYNNEKDLMDAYLLLGFFFSNQKNYKLSLEYHFPFLEYNKKLKNPISIAIEYNNISNIYLNMKEYYNALLYSDSAYQSQTVLPLIFKRFLSEKRYKIFDALGNTDSAYYHFQEFHNYVQLLAQQEDKLNTKKLEEQYQNDKKEAAIKNKNQQMILLSCLLAVIIIASVLLVRKNRKIRSQNKIISKQVEELMKTLEQRQALLSELQHRVKNNLQHVISILEIQKESVDFNNLDELIRENQNRIHSMALLHKKLNISNSVAEVDLERYITEVSELVKNSYDNHKKKITLNIECEIETISIEKALPIGLIITELVSNSMKHAFIKCKTGIINIEIKKHSPTQNKIYYGDNGNGFDINQTNDKGLGIEIIKGLINQLSGTIETKNNNGFELTVYFE